MLKKITALAAVVSGLALPGTALAAALAFTTADLNIRTGPSSSYQRFGTIPQGGRVTVHGCLTGYNWCDVSWAGERGWVSGSYLAYAGERYTRQPIPRIGLSIGVPVIRFSPEVYHRRYYVDRPWYRDRYLDRRDFRRDRRDPWEARRSVREQRQDRDAARRELQRERRDLRDARQNLRRERRD